MKSNQYLYDTDDVPPLPREAINERIRLLKEHRDRLQGWHIMMRPIAQINKIVKAIKFWEELR